MLKMQDLKLPANLTAVLRGCEVKSPTPKALAWELEGGVLLSLMRSPFEEGWWIAGHSLPGEDATGIEGETPEAALVNLDRALDGAVTRVLDRRMDSLKW